MRADALQPGDQLALTGETVVRVFTDRMTKPGYINVLLRKGDRERLAAYKAHRRLAILPAGVVLGGYGR